MSRFRPPTVLPRSRHHLDARARSATSPRASGLDGVAFGGKRRSVQLPIRNSATAVALRLPRPSNQLKSHPSMGAAAASARSSSNERTEAWLHLAGRGGRRWLPVPARLHAISICLRGDAGSPAGDDVTPYSDAPTR